MSGILLAVPDCAQEPDLVTAAPGHGLRVQRRCVDAADLLAAAAADPGAHVVLSAGLPRLSPDALGRLSASAGRRVVGLAPDDAAAARLMTLGVASVVQVGPTPAATLIGLRRMLAAPDDAAAAGVWPTGTWPQDDPRRVSGERAESVLPGRAGTVIGVWGPMGAPGRTTVAIGLAESLGDAGYRVCLVDADTYAPSVAMALGIVDESSGLVVACRHADHGSLTPTTLVGLSRRVRGEWHLLSGLSGPERWADLRAGALDRVWAGCREAFDVTVIDLGFCLEDDDGAAAWSRQRNSAALTALAAADHAVAVADASAAGAARIASAWPSISARLPAGATTIVRNRSRSAGRSWVEAVRASGIPAPIHDLPNDPRSLSACWERGRSLGEGARRSGIRRSLGELAGRIVSG